MSNEFGSNIEGEAASAILPGVKMAPAVIDTPPPPRPETKRVDNRPRVRIVLEENDAIPPTGQFFGYQGVGTLLKPGIEADVSPTIIDILNNAVESVPVVDNVTKQVVGFKPRLRFPYRVISVTGNRQAA